MKPASFLIPRTNHRSISSGDPSASLCVSFRPHFDWYTDSTTITNNKKAIPQSSTLKECNTNLETWKDFFFPLFLGLSLCQSVRRCCFLYRLAVAVVSGWGGVGSGARVAQLRGNFPDSCLRESESIFGCLFVAIQNSVHVCERQDEQVRVLLKRNTKVYFTKEIWDMLVGGDQWINTKEEEGGGDWCFSSCVYHTQVHLCDRRRGRVCSKH